MNSDSLTLRNRIAREAASLLYFGNENEFKQAKQKAAETFKCKFLPTNLEVAIELDKIAEENEGPERKQHLIKMRKEALKTMNLVKAYNPILIGSVWRGTIHRESDIDIRVYHDDPKEVLKTLERSDYKILRRELVTVTERGQKKTSFHVYLESNEKERIEIIVRSSEELNCKEKCETYGDEITGLTMKQLERILEENPAKRFLPV